MALADNRHWHGMTGVPSGWSARATDWAYSIKDSAMKRIFLLCLLTGVACAAELVDDLALSKAFVTSDLKQLSQAQSELVSACERNKQPWDCYRAMLASYHVAVLTLRADPKQAGNAVVSCARLSVDARSAEWAAETDALLSGCYGLSIALNPMKGMSLGPKSAELLEGALSAAPKSARVHYFAAERLWRTPAMWGGSIEAAREHARQAEALIGAQSITDAKPHWGRSEIAYQRSQLEGLDARDSP